MEVASSPYPASFTVDSPEKIARWRPLVQWLLAIPHLIILYALGVVSQVVAIVSWFVVLITGKLPAGIAGLQALYVRYEYRVQAYISFLLEDYPPFSFKTESHDPGDYSRVVTEFEPQLENRNRLTVFFRWLLVIPHIIALIVLGIATFFAMIVAFFAVLFTGRWPEGLRNFVVGVMRWNIRVSAYSLLLTDDYPPFSLE
ncbi:MAG TPA: DUF4389 domain-containing protein [Acidimicrobiales bacterium]